MGKCFHCGEDADMWDSEDRLVCSDCLIIPPGDDSFSRFIRETTDIKDGNNNDDGFS
jgi:hypothetical protein